MIVFDADLLALAQKTGQRALANEARIATAESCTGGLVASLLTSVDGASGWLSCGFVTYTLEAKSALLGVNPDTLSQHGAVSEQTAVEMATGALRSGPASLAVSITGVAGPAGGEILTPVGTVWLAWAEVTSRGGLQVIQTSNLSFPGDRDAVRLAATRTAVEGLLQSLP